MATYLQQTFKGGEKINKSKITNSLFLASMLAILGFTAFANATFINQPDLIVSDITFSQLTSCLFNDSKYSVQIKMFVNNTGNATATNFTDKLQITGGGYPTSQHFSVSSLAPGASISHNKTITRLCGQQITANATADVNNTVVESNENNNNRVETFTPS